MEKIKNQIPISENLTGQIAEKIEKQTRETWFSPVDLTYAYGQVPLSKKTARHCNFQSAGGESTVAYTFILGYYGLTIMSTRFQKIMDISIVNIDCILVYIDNILLVTKGAKEEHINKVKDVLIVLENANMQLKAEKCKKADK